MALQKRRLGPSRIRHRRSAWMRNAARKPLVGACPNCGEPRIPHRVCMSCGHYRDEQIFETAKEEVE